MPLQARNPGYRWTLHVLCTSFRALCSSGTCPPPPRHSDQHPQKTVAGSRGLTTGFALDCSTQARGTFQGEANNNNKESSTCPNITGALSRERFPLELQCSSSTPFSWAETVVLQMANSHVTPSSEEVYIIRVRYRLLVTKLNSSKLV